MKESRNIKAAAIHPTVRPPTDCQLLKAAHFCHPDKNLSLRLNSVRNKTDDYLQAGHPFTNHSFKSSNLPEGAAETPPTWPQTCSLTSLEIYAPPGNLSHPKVKQLLVFIFKLVSVASVLFPFPIFFFFLISEADNFMMKIVRKLKTTQTQIFSGNFWTASIFEAFRKFMF